MLGNLEMDFGMEFKFFCFKVQFIAGVASLLLGAKTLLLGGRELVGATNLLLGLRVGWGDASFFGREPWVC